jgi:ABC-type cobalamin/Fe3+-siderophores transport system ATPase subunit
MPSKYTEDKYMERESKSKTKPEASHIIKIEIIGIFNRFDLIIDSLQPGINILHGGNGSGKTTILHILSNILSGDYGRFLALDFNRIKVIFNNDIFIEIYKDKNLVVRNNDISREIFDEVKDEEQNFEEVEHKINFANMRTSRFKKSLEVAYFPAFRNMIEAWELLKHGDSISSTLVNSETNWKVQLSRKLFGSFVPSLNYMSPHEIEKELFYIFVEARKAVILNNQKILSKSFNNISLYFNSSDSEDVVSQSQNIFDEIKKLAKEITKHPLQEDINFIEGLEQEIDKVFSDDQTSSSLVFGIGVLKNYNKSLKEIVDFQNLAYEPISSYLQAVNTFLIGKKVDIKLDSLTEENFLRLFDVNEDESEFGGIQNLSSGERQILTLIYAITHISSQDIILIDEPEISIHIDQQVELLKSISELSANKQVIVCTHSPTIAGEQIERLREVELIKSDLRKWDCLEEDIRTEIFVKKEQEKDNKEIDDSDFGIYERDDVLGEKKIKYEHEQNY